MINYVSFLIIRDKILLYRKDITIMKYDIKYYRTTCSSSVGLIGRQRGRQGRDRANLLQPVGRCLSNSLSLSKSLSLKVFCMCQTLHSSHFSKGLYFSADNFVFNQQIYCQKVVANFVLLDAFLFY